MFVEFGAEVGMWLMAGGITVVMLLIIQTLMAITLWHNQKKYQNLMAKVAKMSCYLSDLRRLGILPSEPLQKYEGISMGFTVMSNAREGNKQVTGADLIIARRDVDV